MRELNAGSYGHKYPKNRYDSFDPTLRGAHHRRASQITSVKSSGHFTLAI